MSMATRGKNTVDQAARQRAVQEAVAAADVKNDPRPKKRRTRIAYNASEATGPIPSTSDNNQLGRPAQCHPQTSAMVHGASGLLFSLLLAATC